MWLTTTPRFPIQRVTATTNNTCGALLGSLVEAWRDMADVWDTPGQGADRLLDLVALLVCVTGEWLWCLWELRERHMIVIRLYSPTLVCPCKGTPINIPPALLSQRNAPQGRLQRP